MKLQSHTITQGRDRAGARAMLKAIVGFKIDIVRVEAKFKLGQNRSREDQEKMLRNLQSAADEESRALGKFVQTHLKQN